MCQTEVPVEAPNQECHSLPSPDNVYTHIPIHPELDAPYLVH